ncbi:MAG TPA: L-seryl-tRNA(Sec) selenium transferase [Gemmatimonadales bacterium]|jgi:L-seryl-tRNA(Ser) seleniumtransferase|nr:L-seryl-tRNA(Sec) selenium transferase [Gemmatimonadales bacterium]
MTDPRRRLPAVDALLTEPDVAALVAAHPRGLVARAVRETIESARANGGTAPPEGWGAAVRARLERLAAPSLVPVINATGVVLHTNLGRAPLARAAIAAMTRIAGSYSNLEYDVTRGARGSRHTLCRDLLVELTGAEDALVVNNAAGALLVALSALARDGQAIVSRGELVEIGGAFRIPDIMARSGAELVEVGTTNRTHLKDYAGALTPRSKLLLKVHRSNFQVTGFTADVPATELAVLGRERGVASLYDLGSGLLQDLTAWEGRLTGEPTVAAALASGVDAVAFSGDKLLGGPQAGILLGRRAAIEACRTDPLARAVRSDKFTLAALEATLALYREPERARVEIPTLRMLTEDVTEIRRRGETLQKYVGKDAELIAGESEVGGGSFPGAKLKTWLVRLAPNTRHPAPDTLAERLRSGDPPIISRIVDDRVVLDPRTIFDDQIATVARAVRAALDA